MKNLIKKLAISCSVFLFIQPSVNASLTLEEVNLNAYHQHYNTLPNVQIANAELHSSPNFKTFLKDAEEIVTRYELESHVGMRLIHNHFSAGKNQIVAEEYQKINNIPSLISWSQDYKEADAKGALPASWIFKSRNETPLMFEASTDPAVKEGSKMLQKNPEFFHEMDALLDEHQLNKLLAVSLLKREELVGSDDQMFVELIGNNGNVSILQLGYEKDQPESMVRTSWSFKGPKQHGCVQIQGCIPVGDYGHITVFYHKNV